MISGTAKMEPPPPTRPSENPTSEPDSSPRASAARSVGMFPRHARLSSRTSRPVPARRGKPKFAPRPAGEVAGTSPGHDVNGWLDGPRPRPLALCGGLGREVDDFDAPVLGCVRVHPVLRSRLAVADGAQICSRQLEVVDEVFL